MKKNLQKQVRLWPSIGILSVSKGNRLLGNRANFIDIMTEGKKQGANVFVFTPDDLDWNLQLVKGRFYNKSKKTWYTKTLPFPDVVYNRVPNREFEATPYVSETIQKLQMSPRLHLFNPHFFDKWELFQILKTSQLQKYLPETRLVMGESDFVELLRKHKTLYLKPTSGKAGNGIYQVSKQGPLFLLSSSVDGKKVRKQFSHSQQLWGFLQPVIKKAPYIAQQAIPLLTYEGAPFDVRVLVQKNIEGVWEVSGVGYRAAGKDGITTHVPQGGKIIDRQSALDPYFGKENSQLLLNNIKETAIQVARQLDQHYGSLGEMSMDLGVTHNQDIWFFEANAKPMKFDEPMIRKISLQRIIEYSKYLSNTTA